MDTAINQYVETVLAPHLVGLGVASLPGVLNAVVDDIRFRFQSVLARWQDLPRRQTLLFIGREEGMFYQPGLAPLEVRALVVVTVRNSLLEDLGSAGSSLLPPDLPESDWPVKDEDIRSITQEAITYWQRVNLDHLSLPTPTSSQDPFGDLKEDFPHAWNAFSRLAQARVQTVSFEASQALQPPLPVSSLAAAKPKRTVTLSGMSPLFDSRLVEFLQTIQDGKTDIFFADSWKMLTRHPQKLFRILDFVLAHEGRMVTHNYLLTSTMACSRQGLLQPAHNFQEVMTKFRNQVGLTTAHRKALQEVYASYQ